MIPFRALTERIEAYHEDLRVTEESANSLAVERDAIVAVLVEMGLNVTSARRQVARMTVDVAWPEGVGEADGRANPECQPCLTSSISRTAAD